MNYLVEDFVFPASLSGVRLGGMSRVISERFFEERIFSDFAKNVIYKEAEDAFANQIDDADFIGIWQGEFWGKWVIGAAEVCKQTQNGELREFLRAGCHKLLTYAREDGYLNTYKNSLNVFRVDPKEAKLKCNKSVDWNWNIWCRKYTLWGLLSVYEITGDKDILMGARKLADQLIDELLANGIELCDTGTFAGLPSCSILKPMLMLYGNTNDEKYLKFCVEHIADKWERADGSCPNLITNALSGKRLTEWYDESSTWAKAYEMMSCYEGLCELYRYTGRKRYLQAAEGIYEILKAYELNPAFSVAYNDVFADAAGEINLISEPCDAIHWLRLCFELFCLTGDVKYIDSTELTYYNAFLAGVFKDGKWGARGIRGAGAHMWANNQAGMKYQHCCVNNMPRAFTRIAETAVMQTKDFLLVNLYEAADVTISYEGGSARIEIGDGYFDRGRVSVRVVYTGGRKPLKFRIPAWCKSADLTVGGRRYKATSGYTEVFAETDECEVGIDFHIGLQIHAFDQPVAQYGELINGKPHWKVARWLNKKAPGETTEDLFLREARATLTYGPLLLARSKEIGNVEEEMFGEVRPDGVLSAELVAVHTDCDGARLTLDIKLSSDTETSTVKVCDFASAGNQKLADTRYFSIYF